MVNAKKLVVCFSVALMLNAVAVCAPIAGDVDQSGSLGATDVQMVINAVLGIDVPYSTDVNHSGTTDAIDIQLVINAVLGIEIDTDGDGLADTAETNIGTDPHNPDTDGDGVGDGQELIDGTDPLVRPLPPTAPTDLQAGAISSSTIRLTWRDTSDIEEGFDIERSLEPDSGFELVTTVEPNRQSYDDVSLEPATRYYYRVRATNSVGGSGYSNVADATTQNTPPVLPETPTDLAATATSSSSIDITWRDNADNEDGFILERSLSADSGFVSIATLAPDMAGYTDTGLDPSTQYYYRVKSFNGAGNSAPSNIVAVTTLAQPPNKPAPPSDLDAEADSSTSAVLTWQDNSDNEDGFVVERRRAGDQEFVVVDTTGANATSYN
ncbi:MAG: fibronectin type III domain-containing protein, partial [Candidatus Hydrogenedentes bacterium]|nr:fibronectin type III domain-containing protein [Candidatus Hydrogenedentota bacterium]